MDLTDPAQRATFEDFVRSSECYGHSTPNIEDVVNRGAVLSALDALREGRLKSYEEGFAQGDRSDLSTAELPEDVLSELKTKVLRPEPDTAAFDDAARQLGVRPIDVKASFIQQSFDDIKQFVNTQPDPEGFRQQHLSIPKLGPSIFATKGGILDTPAYGDAAVLFRAPDAIPSPHMNLVTGEHILPAIRPFESRQVPLEGSYILAPKEKVRHLEQSHPEYSYVTKEDVPEDINKTILKPPHSFTEPLTRWVPNIAKGSFDPFQTR